MFINWILNLAKIPILPKLTCRSNGIPIKIHDELFTDTEKLILYYYYF